MDDPGNLIYIAFLVISLIAGLIKNWRKKNESKPSTGGYETSIPDMDELKEVVLQRQDKEAVAERKLIEMEAAAKQAKEDAWHRTKALRRETIISEREPAFQHEDSSLIENDDASSENDFDLKKAIIYSEIINPPYL